MSPEEQVAYDLAYFGRDPRAERILVQVISRLPDEAREFALDCRFFSVGGVALGTADKLLLPMLPTGPNTLPPPEEKSMWVITVDERQSDDDLAATIALEIEHAAWLGHDQSESASRQRTDCTYSPEDGSRSRLRWGGG